MGKIKVFPQKIGGNKSEIDILLFFFLILRLSILKFIYWPETAFVKLHQQFCFID
jgi:hypothetical protein